MTTHFKEEHVTRSHTGYGVGVRAYPQTIRVGFVTPNWNEDSIPMTPKEVRALITRLQEALKVTEGTEPAWQPNEPCMTPDGKQYMYSWHPSGPWVQTLDEGGKLHTWHKDVVKRVK